MARQKLTRDEDCSVCGSRNTLTANTPTNCKGCGVELTFVTDDEGTPLPEAPEPEPTTEEPVAQEGTPGK